MKCNVKQVFINHHLNGVGSYSNLRFIESPSLIPITVQIIRFTDFGTYPHHSVSTAPGRTYYFSPLIFTPVVRFNDGDDYMVISIPETPCILLIRVHFAPASPFKLMPKTTELVDTTDAVMKVTPNPASQLAAVSYDLGTEYQKAQSIRIYTLLGVLVTEIDLKANKGDLPLDISRFPAGTYLITLQADGTTVLHQKLIKK